MLLRILVAGPEHLRIARLASKLDAIVVKVEDVQTIADSVRKRPVDLVLLDIGRPTDADLGLIEGVRGISPQVSIVVFAEKTDPDQRARCMTAGCDGVIDLGTTDALLMEALAAHAGQLRIRAARQPSHIPGERHGLGDFAASSPAMRGLLSAARRVVDRDTTVLLLGETGVGKGLLAQSLHNEGSRADGPFVTVNCGSLTETLIESEIFGHEKGSFTGASRNRRGYFEMAHRGTVFLDEVSELPLHLQVKLLRVLEDRRIQPLGSERPVEVDVRLIAASNRDLTREVREKRFRSDLFYRLNVVSLVVPPLRERQEDIRELALGYLEHFSRRLHMDAKQFSVPALALLEKYEWPGNVRELINAVERAVLMGSGPVIGIEDLPADLVASSNQRRATIPTSPPDTVLPVHWRGKSWSEVRQEVLEQAERQYLGGVLEAAGGRINLAARRAGMDPRSLYEKMKRHGLRKEDFLVGSRPAAASGRTGVTSTT
ncbi:MAG: sigma-54 dependent transcriptional regulator [Planctomycetota bacterium]